MPILFVFIALAIGSGTESGGTQLALELIIQELGIGLIVGLGLTAIGTWALRWCWNQGWVTEIWKQVTVVALAIACFSVAQSLHGSGYIAAFTGGLLFGFKLPINFDSPYRSESFAQHWTRWHITLSRFLRDYIYISLGGNRRGKTRRYVNLMITMVLGGLWHGASWNFLIWGGYHGALLAGEPVALPEEMRKFG